MGCVICGLAALTLIPFVLLMAVLAAALREPDTEDEEFPTTEEVVGITLMIGEP